MQLRGHDRPPGRIWHRVHHYVDDVKRAAAQFAEPPFLVGHSLGGLLAQKYLERNPAPGAVLMASIPPGGMIVRPRASPLATRSSCEGEPAAQPAAPHRYAGAGSRAVFHRRHAAGDRRPSAARLQDESYPAFLDVSALALPRPRRVEAPVLVLGAERDGIFTAAEVRRTARAYGTEAEIFAGMGHDMMLDPAWRQVADRVDAWITETAAAS